MQLKALQERANREALSTGQFFPLLLSSYYVAAVIECNPSPFLLVLTQNKMIATLESRLKDSESQHHVMEAEMLHTKILHEKVLLFT